jgi:two-component system, LuxR family, sensor kinase FixL
MHSIVHGSPTPAGCDAHSPPAPGAELADFAAESVIVCDVEGAIRYWNPASEALYGWPATAVIGRNIGNLSTRSSHQPEAWRHLLHQGVWEGPVWRLMASGVHISAVVRQTVRHDPTGRPKDIVEYGPSSFSASDVPARQLDWRLPTAARWELDISGARTLLDTLATLSRQGTVTALARHQGWVGELLAATRVANVNQRAARLLGYHGSRDRMIGRPVGVLWPHQSAMDLAELIVSVDMARPDQVTRTRKFASPILQDPTMTVWRSKSPEKADSVFVAVTGAGGDDRSLCHLRASEQRYRNLIHHLPFALLQVDSRRMVEVFGDLKAEGITDIGAYLDEHPEMLDYARHAVRVTEVNREALSLFGGTTPSDLIGSVDFLFTGTPDMARRMMIAHFDGRRSYAEVAKIRTLDDRARDVRFSVTYPTGPEHLDVTFICIEDLTDRLCTEGQLRRLQSEFTHAARISMLGELTTSIAHEINQPLAAIVTNAQTSLRWLSREEPNVAKVGQLTERIAASAQRASDIVRRIRGMAAKHEPERTPLDMNEIVDEALLLIRLDIESRAIGLSVDFGSDLPRVFGDRIQLQQVIINLLVNSVQAMAQGGGSSRRIELTTGRDESGAVTFSVHDSGPGIAAGDLAHIFESFFTTKDAGMGIGLAICHSIIAAHGGGITASNHPAGGAEFRFWLPVLMGPARLILSAHAGPMPWYGLPPPSAQSTANTPQHTIAAVDKTVSRRQT